MTSVVAAGPAGPRAAPGRLSWRMAVTPVLLLAGVAAVAAWIQQADLDAGAAGVLSSDNLRTRAWEHARLSAVSTALAIFIAVPAGVLATRGPLRTLNRPILFVANVGQTVPTIAVLALMLTVTGIGFRTAVFALWIYSLLPILQNTIVGLTAVDAATVEAAQGMGMTPGSVLRRIEIPLALPVIVAGIRTAAVVNVGTAALGTFIGAGGMGAVIETGIGNQRDSLLYVGAALTGLLALAADWIVGVTGALVMPRGQSQ